MAIENPETRMGIPIISDRPDLNELHSWAKSMVIWLSNLHLNGLQATPTTTAQINQMVSVNDLAQSGKLFFNSDDGQNYKAEVTGGNTLSIKPF